MNNIRFITATAIIIIALLSPATSAAQTSSADLQVLIDTAEPGALLEVPYAIYNGSITISKPLHLKGLPGENGQLPVIDGEGAGTVVTITAPETVVEGFEIRASGNVIDREDGGVIVENAENVRLINNRLTDVLYGIRGVEAHSLQIINNVIGGKDLHIARRGDAIRIWQSENCLVEGNTTERARDAIFWFSDGTIVRGNHFRHSRYGVHMMYTDGMTIEDNELSSNSVGAYLMYSKNVQIRGNTFRENRGPSGYGLALKDMDAVSVADNYYINNRVGIFFDNSPSRIDVTQEIEQNVLAFNDIGVLMMPAVQHNLLRNNTFLDNLEQVGVKGGGSNPGESLGANGWDGNYWSDYVGYDVTDDGTGDLAYRSESLFENLADQHPALELLHFSPIEQAIDLAAQAFPIIKPKPKLTDSTPRMMPLLPQTRPTIVTPTSTMGWLAALFLSSAMLLYWSQRPKFSLDTIRSNASFGRETEPTVHSSPRGDWLNMSDSLLNKSVVNDVLCVTNLSKRYPQPGRAWWSDATITAIDDLSFTLAQGQSLALWGVNGAGKTTVLKCLLGLLNCEGELWLDGMDLRKDGRNARRHFGYVPQELAFHNDLSVAESCRFYARLKNVPFGRISEVLQQVALIGQERKAVGALSGGMKQRLALALALLSDPPVLLLDEPTSNLDAETRDEFLDLLALLHKTGKSLLFTSHHLEEVEQLADLVLILRDGKLVARGTPTELIDQLAPKRLRQRVGPLSVDLSSSAEMVTTVDNHGVTEKTSRPVAKASQPVVPNAQVTKVRTNLNGSAYR